MKKREKEEIEYDAGLPSDDWEDDQFKREEEEYLHSPAKRIVKIMFSGKLAGTGHTKFTPELLLTYFDEVVATVSAEWTATHKKAIGASAYGASIASIRRKLAASKTVQDQLFKLNEFLFS